MINENDKLFVTKEGEKYIFQTLGWKDKLKWILLGKTVVAGTNPCQKCGNPYHFTHEHKWYH